MSHLTDRLYRAWKAQNGSGSDRRGRCGGMGDVSPMGAQKTPTSSDRRENLPTPARVADSRPDRPVSFTQK